MRFLKSSISILFAVVTFFMLFLLNSQNTLAAEQKYITIVNPVRGSDFFQLQNQKPADNVKRAWQGISDKKLSATWLVRFDALEDSDITTLLKSFNQNQELGLFLEVTPTWARSAGVTYRQSQSWHFAGSVLLTGYEVVERQKLIDAAFVRFKDTFGFYPKSVGAWWVDAGSLKYMRQKYQISANMDVADQYTTDNYQVWGQYFSTPFYPSDRNALVPASGVEDKIGVVTVQWAARDPYNSYGNGVLDSTYSVQANDYANPKFHKLTTDYFKKILSIYLDNPYSKLGQVVIGLENDFSWQDFGDEYLRQLGIVSDLKNQGVAVTTLSKFSNSYQSLYPTTSPEQIIFTKDPLSSSGYVLWYQTLRFRIGWFSNSQGSVIRDLRTYYNNQTEPCLEKRCEKLNLAMTEVKNIDEVTYGSNWLIDYGRVSDPKVTLLPNGVKLQYLNQAGIIRTLQFLPNDVVVDNISRPISTIISEQSDSLKVIKKIESNFNFQLADGLPKVLLDQTKGFLLFIIFSSFFFFYPGSALLVKVNLDKGVKFLLSWPVGLCLFTLSSFLFGYLKMSWLIFLLPFVSLILVRHKVNLPKFRISKQGILALLLIIIGSISWLLTSLKNGLVFDYGMGFWGPHGHDALWHLSIIESLKMGLPPQNPLFAGEVLKNYHYFYDLLLSQVSLITSVPAIDLYFRFFPILISLLCGFLTFILAKEWLKSELTAILAVFFVYFGGSFGWILTYLKDRGFGGETTFWAQQGISTLINPPFAISIVIFLAGLYLFLKILEHQGKSPGVIIPLVITWGTLIEFKAYAGILVLLSLAILTLIQLVKKDLSFIKISLPIALLSAAVFLPNNLSGTGLLVFSPWWLIHSMIDFPDRLYFMRLSYSRIVNLESGNYFKFIIVELATLLIFIIGNLGTRMVGLLSFRKLKVTTTFNLFLSIFLIFSLVIPLLFIQKGANFNIVQFFYYFIFILNFLAALSISILMARKKLAFLVILMMVLFTMPTTMGTLKHYLPQRPPARISRAELDALTFLRKQSDGIVLSYYNGYGKEAFVEPKPLYVYESSAYVGALSAKPEYLSDTVNLDILGIDYKGRQQIQMEVYLLKDNSKIKELLLREKIGYVYAPKLANVSPDQQQTGLQSIFKNDEVEIYKVVK